MIRSAHLGRPLALLLLSLLAVIVVATGVAGSASAATQVGNYTLYTTNELCKLTVAPHEASAEVGAQQEFTATVSAIGPAIIEAYSVDASYSDTFSACALKQIDALEGVTVRFTVVSGPNAGKTEEVPLDANGVAKFSFTSAVAGVDVVKADLTLPDICFSDYTPQQNVQADAVIPDACAGNYEQSPQVEASPYCGGLQVAAVEDCPTVTLTDSGQVTWSAPSTVVQSSADPSMSIAARKRCVTGQFTIAPTYSGGTISSSTLFVDGRRKRSNDGSKPFSLSARSYKAGKHNFEVVTVFTNGKAASKFGSFTRCAARVTVKRVSPKFTG